jgi:hypothetical protein
MLLLQLVVNCCLVLLTSAVANAVIRQAQPFS